MAGMGAAVVVVVVEAAGTRVGMAVGRCRSCKTGSAGLT